MKFVQSTLSVSILSFFFGVVIAQFPFEKPFLNLATGTIMDTIFDKFLGLGSDEKPKCALSLTNNLTNYRLVDPFVYLEHGGHTMPVPVKIEIGSTMDTVFEAADAKKDTSGLVFYNIEKTGHYLVIFWKVSGPQAMAMYSGNRFYVDILKANEFSDQEKTLNSLYLLRKSLSEKKKNPLVDSKSVDILGVKTSQRPTITYQAQMTTEKDGKLTVLLTESATLSPLHKRVAASTIVGVAFATKVLNVIFKKVRYRHSN